MNETTEITTVSEDNLRTVVGGWSLFGSGSNQDTGFDVLGGLVARYKSRSRTDEGYRIDATAAACTQANTTTERTLLGTRQVVNQPAAAQCLLDRLGPLPPANTGTGSGE